MTDTACHGATLHHVRNQMRRRSSAVQVNKEGPAGSTALMMMATVGTVEEVQLLLMDGVADCNLEAWQFKEQAPPHFEHRSYKCWKHRCTPLIAAAIRGDVAILELLLNKGAIVNHQLTAGHRTGSTALWWAALRGHVQVMQLLLRRGACVHATATDSGATAMHMAASAGQTEAILLLRHHGGNINARLGPSVILANATPLFFAIRSIQVHAVETLILNGANPSQAIGNIGYTPLYSAVLGGCTAIVTLLLAHGATPHAVVTGHSADTMLMAASRNGFECIVGHLLAAGANPNVRAGARKLPLTCATEQGNVAMVCMLLNAGANPNADQPLVRAAHSGLPNVVKHLLLHGADLDGAAGHYDAIHAAAKAGCAATMQVLAMFGANLTLPSIRTYAANSKVTSLASWVDSTGSWTPLQHIAAARAPVLGSHLHKVGLLDNLVPAAAAAKRTAASTRPWGPGFAVRPPDRATTTFITRILRGWTPHCHGWFPASKQLFVHGVLLVEHRRRQRYPTAVCLPPELWHMIINMATG
jgi:ankyrin repeat protein